jgi:hypothetical protein
VIEFVMERRWTREERDGYQSGYGFVDRCPLSAAWRVLIDACAARMPAFDRHEIVHGVWRDADDRRMAAGVGAVRTNESPHAVSFFRAAYLSGDAKMRQRIRNLAALSISHPERLYEI